MAGIFRSLLAEQDRLIRVFAISRIAHPVLIDMFGIAGGYDGLWLDQEHAGLTTEQMTMACITGRSRGLGCFVRLATPHYSLVNQALESGADGVMAARVHSADEAEQFVRWAKFAPRGLRGMNSGGADADYTFKPMADLAVDANRDQLLAIQIETAAAVEQVEAIAALESVDMLFVGPADLSQELGVLGQLLDDKLWDAIAKVADACRNHGKAWGSVAGNPDYARRAADLDCRLLTFGSDVECVHHGIDGLKAHYADFF